MKERIRRATSFDRPGIRVRVGSIRGLGRGRYDREDEDDDDEEEDCKREEKIGKGMVCAGGREISGDLIDQ